MEINNRIYFHEYVFIPGRRFLLFLSYNFISFAIFLGGCKRSDVLCIIFVVSYIIIQTTHPNDDIVQFWFNQSKNLFSCAMKITLNLLI